MEGRSLVARKGDTTCLIRLVGRDKEEPCMKEMEQQSSHHNNQNEKRRTNYVKNKLIL